MVDESIFSLIFRPHKHTLIFYINVKPGSLLQYTFFKIAKNDVLSVIRSKNTSTIGLPAYTQELSEKLSLKFA